MQCLCRRVNSVLIVIRKEEKAEKEREKGGK